MTGLVFVDSNIFVYQRDSSAGRKQQRAATWLDRLWRDRAGRVSAQVLNEYYHVVTRRLKPGLTAQEAREDVRHLFSWRPIPLSRNVIEAGWEIEDRFGFSYWDALIVAAARVAGCRYLLTEDLQDGQDLDGITVVDPFQHEPGDVA